MSVDFAVLNGLRSSNVREREQTYSLLYERLFPQILAFVGHKGGGYEDAIDLLQEAMVVVIERTSDVEFELQSKIDTYIYAVVKYKWYQILNKRSLKRKEAEIDPLEYELLGDLNMRFPLPGLDHLEEIDPADHENLDIHTTAENIVIELMQDEKFEKCRKVLLDFYWHNKSMEEIAEAHQFSQADSAKSQKAKCMTKLKIMCSRIPFLQRHFLRS